MSDAGKRRRQSAVAIQGLVRGVAARNTFMTKLEKIRERARVKHESRTSSTGVANEDTGMSDPRQSSVLDAASARTNTAVRMDIFDSNTVIPPMYSETRNASQARTNHMLEPASSNSYSPRAGNSDGIESTLQKLKVHTSLWLCSPAPSQPPSFFSFLYLPCSCFAVTTATILNAVRHVAWHN